MSAVGKWEYIRYLSVFNIEQWLFVVSAEGLQHVESLHVLHCQLLRSNGAVGFQLSHGHYPVVFEGVLLQQAAELLRAALLYGKAPCGRVSAELVEDVCGIAESAEHRELAEGSCGASYLAVGLRGNEAGFAEALHYF